MNDLFGTETPAQLPQIRPEAPSEYFGPTNFTWLLRGRLGGMPQPGLIRAFDHDAEAITRMGVTTVVTLTAEWQAPEGQFAQHGLENIHVAIPDMAPPTLEQALTTCRRVAEILDAGGTVAFHCRAGRGRTGTMLAAMLIWYRQEFDTAIRSVKAANRNWIESESQMRFLDQFAAMHLAKTDASHTEVSTEGDDLPKAVGLANEAEGDRFGPETTYGG